MACCDRRLSSAPPQSVCPTCLATVPAERFAEGDVVYLRRPARSTARSHADLARPRLLSALGSGAARLFAPAGRRDAGRARLPARLRPLPRSSPAELLRAAGGDLALRPRLSGLLRLGEPQRRRRQPRRDRRLARHARRSGRARSHPAFGRRADGARRPARDRRPRPRARLRLRAVEHQRRAHRARARLSRRPRARRGSTAFSCSSTA